MGVNSIQKIHRAVLNFFCQFCR